MYYCRWCYSTVLFSHPCYFCLWDHGEVASHLLRKMPHTGVLGGPLRPPCLRHWASSPWWGNVEGSIQPVLWVPSTASLLPIATGPTVLLEVFLLPVPGSAGMGRASKASSQFHDSVTLPPMAASTTVLFKVSHCFYQAGLQ